MTEGKLQERGGFGNHVGHLESVSNVQCRRHGPGINRVQDSSRRATLIKSNCD